MVHDVGSTILMPGQFILSLFHLLELCLELMNLFMQSCDFHAGDSICH